MRPWRASLRWRTRGPVDCLVDPDCEAPSADSRDRDRRHQNRSNDEEGIDFHTPPLRPIVGQMLWARWLIQDVPRTSVREAPLSMVVCGCRWLKSTTAGCDRGLRIKAKSLFQRNCTKANVSNRRQKRWRCSMASLTSRKTTSVREATRCLWLFESWHTDSHADRFTRMPICHGERHANWSRSMKWSA